MNMMFLSLHSTLLLAFKDSPPMITASVSSITVAECPNRKISFDRDMRTLSQTRFTVKKKCQFGFIYICKSMITKNWSRNRQKLHVKQIKSWLKKKIKRQKNGQQKEFFWHEIESQPSGLRETKSLPRSKEYISGEKVHSIVRPPRIYRWLWCRKAEWDPRGGGVSPLVFNSFLESSRTQGTKYEEKNKKQKNYKRDLNQYSDTEDDRIIEVEIVPFSRNWEHKRRNIDDAKPDIVDS